MTPAEIEALPYRPNVGVMLVNPAGRIFVGERIDTPGAWQMPQGGIDPGEEPATAALRELHEETGVPPELARIEAETPGWLRYDLPADLVPSLWNGRYRGQEQKWFLMRFLGDDDRIDITVPPREFARWRWVAPDEVLDLIVPFKRPVYADVLRSFADRLDMAG